MSKHPHPNKRFIMETYRQFILSQKKRFGTARSFAHYKEIIQEYLACKRIVIAEKKKNEGS